MSYILDALKKSEREKTLGQVPTLETVVADGAKRQPKGTPWWLNLLVFVVVLLAVLAGLYFAGLINIGADKSSFAEIAPATNETADNQNEQQTESNTIVEQTQIASEQVNQIQQTQQQPTQATAVDKEPVQPVATQQNNLAAQSQQQAPAQTATEPAVEQVAELEEIVLAEQQATAQQQAEELAAQQQALIQQQAEELAALQQAQQQTVTEPVQQEQQPSQPAATDSSSPDYEEVLHQNLRNVAVNVVSYSSDARQRFVMLDLTIYKEGDSLPVGADIVEIIRSGAIVDYQNKRYLLKP